MPFDPTIPPTGGAATSQALRDQFNGLKDLIDTIPVGPVGPIGPQGDPGPPFAGAVVDSTTTSLPGSSASVGVNFDGTNVRFTFDIPQGIPGEVSAAFLATEISNLLSNTSGNSNGVALLLPTNASPTLMDVALKLDELIQALRR
jgi:hypothetical protein